MFQAQSIVWTCMECNGKLQMGCNGKITKGLNNFAANIELPALPKFCKIQTGSLSTWCNNLLIKVPNKGAHLCQSDTMLFISDPRSQILYLKVIFQLEDSMAFTGFACVVWMLQESCTICVRAYRRIRCAFRRIVYSKLLNLCVKKKQKTYNSLSDMKYLSPLDIKFKLILLCIKMWEIWWKGGYP